MDLDHLPDPAVVVERRDGVSWIAALPRIARRPPGSSIFAEVVRGAPAAAGESQIEPKPSGPSIASPELRLFEFVQAWRDLNAPPPRKLAQYDWTLGIDNLPTGPDSELRTGADPALRSDGVLLAVRRPRPVLAPPPPAELAGWIAGEPSDWKSQIGFRAQRLTPVPGAGHQATAFDADPARRIAWIKWAKTWYLWGFEERQRAEVAEVYARLFELRARLDGRSHEFELTLGSAVLDWPLAGGAAVDHPLVLKRVFLDFDSKNAEITVRDGDTAVEFGGRALADTPVAGRSVALARKLTEESQPHPLDRDGILLFLRGVINSWFGDVSFEGGGVPRPDLRYQPTLFLRRAGSQVGAFVEHILAELKGGAEGPEFLRWLTGESQPPAIGETPREPSAPDSQARTEPDDFEDDLFFTKPANAEQRKILRLLESQPGIVVQGPPGTGKTHTIANLVGHFLAKGWRVLVTSETAKALGEVRGQVVPGLSSLCVPLLDSDRDGRELLRACLQEINNQATQRTEQELRREVIELERERKDLLAERRTLRRQLLDARHSEELPIVVAGVEHRPIAAAKLVAASSPGCEWLPVPLVSGVGCPLSDDEVSELYASNATLPQVDERALEGVLPDPATLASPEGLDRLLQALREGASDCGSDNPGVWKPATRDDATLASIELRVEEALREFQVVEPWRLAAVEAGLMAQTGSWSRMLDAASEAQSTTGAASEVRFRYQVELGGADHAEDLAVARAIHARLLSGGALRNWLGRLGDPSWKVRLDAWRFGGKELSAPQEFGDLVTLLCQIGASRDFVRRFEALVTAYGGPDTATVRGEASVALRQYVEIVGSLLGWHGNVWLPLRQHLVDVGLDVDRLVRELPPIAGEFAEARRVVTVLRDRVGPLLKGRRACIKRDGIADALSRHGKALRAALAANPDATVLSDAVSAFEGRDVPRYRAALVALSKLRAKAPIASRRRVLLGVLRPAAPAWADAVATRAGLHAGALPPGEAKSAWMVRQLEEELTRRHRVDVAALSESLSLVERRLPAATASLVASRAWLHQIARLRTPAGLALRQWAHVMQQAGAGQGARAQDLLRAAQRLAAEAMTAVPVWIMPIWRVFQTVLPSATGRFDVAIVDEASQADLRALPLLYLANRVIVVGDKEQVTPLAVGESVDALRRLQREYLSGFRVPEMFDGRASLYSVAETHFGQRGVTALTEHFRCVPDIIAFSDNLCYRSNGRPLRPLREAAKGTIQPAVVPYRVVAVDGVSGVNDNVVEARAITALLAAMLEHPAYQAATFGVIHLVGDEQDRLIEETIRKQLALDDDAIERIKGGGRSTRRLCGKPPDFQGDERSVVLLSMVDRPAIAGGPLSRRDTDTFKQRFNVAASRAKDQMWLVHSLDPSRDLQTGDLRRRLIEHCRNPATLRLAMEEGAAATESPFELEVLQALISRGYRVRPQFRVGALRIDLLVTDGKTSLAVECDGERFHGPERLHLDIERQRVLERLGHTFHRIRGSAFYRNRERALSALFADISRRGIEPVAASGLPDAPLSSGLHLDIIRVAERKMIGWGWIAATAEGGATIGVGDAQYPSNGVQ